ncbi:MAG: MBL fold metallo-hydrolase [Flavobacteriaceae bacterium]|nr:MBL fold metallo-hydrolase [Flavobacteriaceae bacterium]
MFKVIFLGTGTSQGIPVVASTNPVCFSTDKRDKRLRVSVAVEWDNFRYIIDCGPDFRYQMLRENINHIDGILFTHEHADHTAGLDDIRPFSFQLGGVPMYAHPRVIENLSRRFDYIFTDKNKYPGAPSLLIHKVDKLPFLLKNKWVTPIEANHADIQVLGYRFQDFAYLTDIKIISSEEKEKLKGLKVLVLNALREKSHFSHLNIEEALQLIEELKPEKTYFTHISIDMGFHAETEKKLPENVFLAYDGLQITI